MMSFDEMRADFIIRRKGMLALPMTGAVVYSAAALLSVFVDVRLHNLVLTLCFWSIMPVAVVISRARGEDMSTARGNQLLRLSAMARAMALATWARAGAFWVTLAAGFGLRRAGPANVRFWPKADIGAGRKPDRMLMSAYDPKRTSCCSRTALPCDEM